MNDTWIGKDEKTIMDDILSIAKEETGLTSFKSVGVLRGFLEVIKYVVVFIYKTAINSIYDNASLDGATGFFLTCWGLALGVTRKQSAKTEGRFRGAAYGAGKIPAGAWIVVEGTDLRYKVTEEVSFLRDDFFDVPVIAEFEGSDYNIGAGIPLLVSRVIAGLDLVSVEDEWITSLGEEVEEDEPYRQRIKTRWREQTLGDTKDTYKYYAEQVQGVRSAKIIRAPRGPGSTDVVVASINGAPDQALLDAVKAHLHDHELMSFDVEVKSPEILEVEITIEYSGDQNETEIRLIAERYIYSIGIGGRFQMSKLYELYRPLKCKTIEILSPDRDIQAEALYLVVGAITVTQINT
jgi:uncharacterized phage protein gp47/JayE